MLTDFFQLAPIPSDAMTGDYNPILVTLSYIVAVFASYVALDIAGRLRAQDTKSLYWLIGGAFAMGAGIWSMHFIGMLAFVMPMPMSYAPFMTALSMLVAILASGLAMFLFKKQYSIFFLVGGGIILGLAIATMHYTGMAAMQGVKIHYTLGLFILSILIAVFASEAALSLVAQSNMGSIRRQMRLKISSALVMGAAICGMHYTGMAAAVFTSAGTQLPTRTTIDPNLLAIFIASTTLLILGIAIMTSTYKQMMSSALEKEREFLKALLSNLADGILACDSSFNLTLFNRAARKIHDLSEDEPITKNWEEKAKYYHLDGKTPLLREEMPLRRVFNNEILESVEIIILSAKDKKNPPRYLKVDGQAIINSRGEKLGAVIAMHDVTEQKKLEKQLIEQATYDPLTHLPNRPVFYDRIKQAIAFARRNNKTINVLFINLDRFKIINDTLGHDAGDALLIEVSNRLLKYLREGDTVTRLAGDEFVTILNESGNIVTVAQKILNAIAAPYYIDGQEAHITASIGICVYPKDGQDAEALVRNAETAMYGAKHAGGNNFKFYTAEMNLHLSQRLIFEKLLHRALQNKEFDLFFQPIIDLKSGKLISGEALLRWNIPTMGLVNPFEFIPLAEEMGLIVEIGEWVLRTACKQIKDWQQQKLPTIKVAVNISSVQFKSQPMDVVIKKILQETGLDPKYLDIELTESILLENNTAILNAIINLKELGVGIVLDDFGTGYSSLAYLKKFPIAKLKIDQSFIKGIPDNADDVAIVLGVIALATALKIRTVAEGVENADQLNLLRANHCDEVQGFYFEHPLKAQDFENLLKSDKHFK